MRKQPALALYSWRGNEFHSRTLLILPVPHADSYLTVEYLVNIKFNVTMDKIQSGAQHKSSGVLILLSPLDFKFVNANY
jgi:hypothetical protein